MSRRAVQVAAALIALTLAGLLFAPDAAESDDVRRVSASSYAAGPAGAKALYLLLERTGVPVERFRSNDYAELPDGTLWILSETPLSGIATQALSSWLFRGNRVIGPPAALAPLLEEVAPKFEAARASGEIRADDGAVLDSGHAEALTSVHPPVHVFATAAGDPVVASWAPLRGGSIVVLGLPDIARNDRIGKADNGRFLWGLASAPNRQIFDETQAGLGEGDLFSLLRQVPYRLVLLQLALALAVLLIGLSFRRFPADAPPPVRRRSTLDHLAAVARFWGLAKDPRLPLREIAAAVAARARRRGGSGASPFAAWVGLTRPDLAAVARATFDEAAALCEGTATPEAACAAAGKLLALEREAARW